MHWRYERVFRKLLLSDVYPCFSIIECSLLPRDWTGFELGPLKKCNTGLGIDHQKNAAGNDLDNALLFND